MPPVADALVPTVTPVVVSAAYVDALVVKVRDQGKVENKAVHIVVGVDLDYEVMGRENGMLMVSASGTAVVIE